MGQVSKPWIQAVIDMWGLKEGVIETASKKREWFALGNVDGRTLIDETDNWDGKESWVDKYGKLNHRTVNSHNDFPVLTGRMKVAESANCTIEFFTRACVRGGSWLPSDEPGAENRTQYVSYETPANPDLENQCGIIRYETIIPELTTIKECQTAAENLLKMFKANQNKAMPAVIGRSPDLTDKVQWQTRRLQGFDGWQATALQTARVSARKDEVNVTSGYVSYLEVQPNFVAVTPDQDPTVLPDPDKTNDPNNTSLADTSTYKGTNGNQYQHHGDQWMVFSKGQWSPATPPANVTNNYDLVRTTSPSTAPNGVEYST
jgi:hypothetical protein